MWFPTVWMVYKSLDPSVTHITIQKILWRSLYTLYVAWFYFLKLKNIHTNKHSSASRVDYISSGLWILRSYNLIFSILHICSQRMNCILDCPISVSLGKKKKKLDSIRPNIILCGCPLIACSRCLINFS